MKKTKRQQNSMIINVVFNTALLVIFLWILGLYIYPGVTEISEKKQNVQSLSNDIERVKISWVSFEEFSVLRNTKKNEISDLFIQKLLEKVDKPFYTENIKNTSSGSFVSYLESRQTELQQQSDVLNERSEDVNTILPSYGAYVSDDNVVTDFLFTSYLERLFTTFNLQYDGKIGIWELKPIGLEDSAQSSAQQELNASIYSTQVKLDIVWRKRDIINFIHYFENVGAIEILDDDLKVYSDNAITQLGKNTVLSGDNRTNSYNIYLHQLGDIDYIRMKSYLDSSLNIRDIESQDFLSFIKQNQWTQRYEFEVGLNFYFKGLPKYKAREFITEFIKAHQLMKKTVKQQISQVSKKSSPSTQDGQYLGQLKSIDTWLISSTKQVQQLSKELKDANKIDVVYRQVIDLSENLAAIQALIDLNTTSTDKQP